MNNIKRLREEAGLTQLELANTLKTSRTSVTAWELGTSSPTAVYLIKLSKLFGCSVDYILGLQTDQTLNLDELEEDEKKLILQVRDFIVSKRKG